MSNWSGEDFLPFDFKYANIPVKDLVCEYCKSKESPAQQFRLHPSECGQKTTCIGWVCSKCEGMNLTADDLSVLDDEIVD